MPRLEDLVNLSAAVYGNPPLTPVLVPSSQPGVNETWTFLFDSGRSDQPGYYGAAFFNEQTKELVLVNRGTNDLADLVTDMQMALDVVPDQLEQAEQFYTRVQAAAVARGATLSITGHSLGGSLTQLLIATHAGETFGGVPIFGQTFNAFGARGLLNNLGLADVDYRVTNWVTPTDVVANLAEHIGTRASLTSLPFSYIYPAGPPGVLAFLYDSHKIAQVRDTFIADNSHPLLTETREFLIQTYVTDFAFPVTIDGQVIVGGNNRINVGNELTGSAQNDLLFGGLPEDRIRGGDGQDIIYAGPGNDTIWGEADADIMLGEDGNDTYLVDDVGDRVIEAVGGGTDTIASTASYTLSRNVEQLLLQGLNAINGTGNEFNNVLIGNAAANILDGGLGQDSMAGGAGNDTYILDNPGDSVTEATNEGTDTVVSPFSFTLVANVENLMLTGSGDLNGTGNELNNDITGNSGINRLDGKGGTDHLIGNGGNDVLIGGVGNNDLLEGGTGFDTYIYNAGDGFDRIEDSDASGQIIFNGHRLLGGIHYPNDPLNTYMSLDGLTTYMLSGTDLVVNGVLTVNENFQSGQFGVQLEDLSSYPTNTGVPTGPFQHVYLGTEGGDFMGNGVNAGNNGAYYGLGGNDHIIADVIGDNLQDGGADDDILQGRSGGNEYLDGGAGNDYVFAYMSFDLEHAPFYNGIFDGNDILLGGIGDDVLVVGGALPVGVAPDPDYLDGGEGTDYLRGEVGADRLLGGDGDDTLRGDNLPDGWPSIFVTTDNIILHVPGQADFSATGGADFLEGGSGNDLLVGDGGDDILSGGADNDQLFGDDEAGYLVAPGDDVLDGGAGDDRLAGGDGADSLSGGAGIDQLFGDKGLDILDGGDEADMLHGGDGADELHGGAGDDQLFGDGLNNLLALSAAGGADFLDGGAGNDHLEGGIGDDTLFGGVGNDVLFGEEGADSLLGDDGADELQGGAGNDLLSGDAGDDRLFGQADNDTLYGGEGNDQLAGNDGVDTLVGGSGSDLLEGGHGNDGLLGGAGQDLYNISFGDGQDTITDRAQAGEGNLIQFFGGITLGSLSFIQDQAQQTLTIQVGGGGDSIRLLGFDPNTFNYVVDTLSFADGTQVALADQLPLPGGLIEGTEDSNVIRTGATDDTIFAGAGNDVVFGGAGHDVIVGGAGADTLQGGAGQDTYVFNSGDGIDTISDQAGEGNRLVFGAGVSSGAITLGLGVGESVSVRTGVAGDAIQILANLESGESPSIDALEFADGTTLSIGELFVRGIEITGTAGVDTLTGTNSIDRISGGDGNDFVAGDLSADILHGDEGSDQLFGGDGDDQLDGGAGADVLKGEAGQDTYVFGRGYGRDILQDFPVEQSGPNTIQLISGVGQEDIRLQARQSHDGINVVLTIVGTQDELTLLGVSDPSLLPINEIRFTDGAIWDTAEILAHIEGVQLTASATGSFLEGTGFRDVLIGAQGNDRLDGLGGADRMVGGASDDMYWVNQLGDAVVEALGEGQDTVLSQIDYRLPDHVENLYLRSTAQPVTDPVRGEGNEAANLLLGDFVNNVLIGGGGEDILWGNFGVGGDYGPGDDDLYGGAGNDSYVIEGSFNGFDTIHDVALPGEGNRLQFGNSVRPEDVVFVQESANLRVTNSGGTDGAVLVDFDPSGIVGSLVTEVVAFSGGYEDVTGGYETSLLALMNPTVGTDSSEILTGTANAEVIKAQAGDDVIAGGAGNDVLLGGAGSDTYVFNQGDGFDLIDDQSGAGTINLVQFGAGITSDMLRVFYSGTFGTSGLSVRIGTSGDGLHFLGVSADDPTAPHAIDTFHFVDGTQLTFAELFEREVVVQGTGRSDGELFGTVADDRMLGLSGSEVLSSWDGNDTLIGGPGNDVLAGGRGNDTYVFNPGDGIDTITEVTGAGTNNTIVFGPGINVGDLTLGLGSLLIRVGTDGDAIHLEDFNPNNVLGGRHSIDMFRFADDTSLTYTQLIALGFDIPGTIGDDVLIGTNVVDRLVAGAGNDQIESRAGNDFLDGGTGADQLLGGRGDDTYVVDNAGDMVTEQLNEGTDTVESSITYTLGANLENLTLIGTATITGIGNTLDNVLIGNSGNNVLAGGGGADMLAGGGGDDAYVFNVGDGIDTIQDASELGAGNRIQFGTGVAQTDLTFTQDQAARTLTIQAGSSGTDKLILANFDPTGTNGSLVVETLAFADGTTASLASLLGGPINHAPTLAIPIADQTAAEDSAFTFTVPATTFADEDLIHGDVLTYSAALANGSALPTWLSFNPITRTFSGTPGAGDASTLQIAVMATDNGSLSVAYQFVFVVSGPLPQTFTGTAGNDVLTGGRGDDTLSGLAGNDTLNGRQGHDLLDGGTGTDTMLGGLGNDTYIADVTGDSVTELAGEGTDTVQTALPTYALGANVENLILTGTGPKAGFGNALTNTLTGNSGANLLDGGAGADTMAGGAGDDLYIVDNVGDVVTEQANEGTLDSVTSSVTYSLSANVEHLVLVGSAVINGTGNALDNILTGNSAANVLTGGAGNDTYVIGAGDTVVEAAGGGIDTVISTVAHTLATNVENLTLLGLSTIAGTGNGLDNILNGDANPGANVLTGGAGNDTYIIGASDTVVEAANAGTDWVQSSVTHTLGTNVENLTLTGTSAINGTGNSLNNVLQGNSLVNTLSSSSGNDTLAGGRGNDVLNGGAGNDLFKFFRGDGQDLVQDNSGAADTMQFGATINPLDLVISRQANDLRLAIHGSSDQMTVQNWYVGTTNRMETIQAGNGQVLFSTQVDQLIQAMASFGQQSGLTWDQAIDQQPAQVQSVLAASWQ